MREKVATTIPSTNAPFYLSPNQSHQRPACAIRNNCRGWTSEVERKTPAGNGWGVDEDNATRFHRPAPLTARRLRQVQELFAAAGLGAPADQRTGEKERPASRSTDDSANGQCHLTPLQAFFSHDSNQSLCGMASDCFGRKNIFFLLQRVTPGC